MSHPIQCCINLRKKGHQSLLICRILSPRKTSSCPRMKRLSTLATSSCPSWIAKGRSNDCSEGRKSDSPGYRKMLFPRRGLLPWRRALANGSGQSIGYITTLNNKHSRQIRSTSSGSSKGHWCSPLWSTVISSTHRIPRIML